MLSKIRRFLIEVMRPERIVPLKVSDDLTLQLFSTCDTSLVRINKYLIHEPYTVEWIMDMPEGSVFYDIGANVGVYSLIALHTGKRVVAFEPYPPNLYLLYKNMQLNPCGDNYIKVVPLGLGRWHELTYVPISPPRDEPGAANLYEKGITCGEIPTLALDNIPGLPTPKYVKIDVDGPELHVIEGGWQTIKHARQIQLEQNHNYTDILTPLGFLHGEVYHVYKNHCDIRYTRCGQ